MRADDVVDAFGMEYNDERLGVNSGFYILLLSYFTIKVQDDVNSFICICYLKIVK